MKRILDFFKPNPAFFTSDTPANLPCHKEERALPGKSTTKVSRKILIICDLSNSLGGGAAPHKPHST